MVSDGRATRSGHASGLVGREGDLHALRAGVSRAAEGGSGVVLVTGPPGVGKTRLAHAALEMAAAVGFATLSGRAHPLSREVAYAPLVEAFGGHLRALEEERRSALVGDLPQLGLVLSGLGLTAPPPLGDPALENGRLLDAFLRLTDRLAGERPVALLLDDVHAADAATFAFARQLASGSTENPVLLLLTALADQQAQERTAVLTAVLDRSPWWLDHRTVAPLDRADATALVREVVGAGAGTPLVDRVVDRCAGRPLLLAAVARTIQERAAGGQHPDGADVPVPEGVRAQLLGRVSGCLPEERAVLELLAVAGGSLDLSSIVAASNLGRPAVIAALDSLHHRALLQEDADGFDVVHGLLRDVLTAELSPIADKSMHAGLVTALAVTRPGDQRIAEHALAAGDLIEPRVAFDHLAAGAGHARSLGMAPAETRYLAAALEIADTVEPTATAGLLDDYAGALRRTGRAAEARTAWESALAAYEASGEAGAAARVEQELGMLDWSSGQLTTARVHFDNAARILDGVEPTADHAALRYAEIIIASRVGDAETVARVSSRLRELAGALATPRAEAQACLAEAIVDYAATDYVAMAEKNLRALEAARQCDDRLLMIRAHDQLSVAAASELDLASLREHSEASLALAREIGAVILQPWPNGRLAVASLLAGQWDAALRGTSEMTANALRYDEQRGMVSSSAMHAWVLVHRGRLADAREHLRQARLVARPMLESDRNVFSVVAIADATLALFEGDSERAVDRAAQLEDTAGGWMPLLGLAVLGEACARADDPDRALSFAERLRAVRSTSTRAPLGLSSWIQGLVAIRGGRPEEALVRTEAAGEVFDELGMPFHAARAQLASASARASLVAAAPEEATSRARSALVTFERVGAPVQAQKARELLRGLGVVPSRGRHRQANGSALSPRELEVSRLVAAGLSNAQVATELFISPRTVSTHLDHVYSRLGLGSRVALTRYLAASGLLEFEEGREPAAPSTDSAT